MSRTFELLRQAQRDQALLKQNTQVVATKSRNFEVLHQAGADQQLFETVAVPAEATERAGTLLPTSAAPMRGQTFKLVLKLFLAPDAPSPRVLLFACVEHVIEHYRICTRVAELLASHTQRSVCVVDANVTAPSLHRDLGVDNAGGLAAAMIESGPAKDFTVRVGEGRLSFMPAGHLLPGTDWNALLAGVRMSTRIGELRASFDHVLIAAPPVTGHSGPAYLGSLADGVVAIVEPSVTPREAARELKEEIEIGGGRLLGVVWHRRALSFPDLSPKSQGSRKPR